MSVELTLADLSFDGSALKGVKLHCCVDTVHGGPQPDTLEAVIHANAPVEAQALQEQKVQLYRDGSLIATQCIKSCTRTGSRDFTLSCRSDMDFLEGKFMGGIYQNVEPTTLANQILLNRTFHMDSAIMNRKVSGYLPICTRAEALHQMAFALGAVVSMDKDGSFFFSDPERSTPKAIGAGRILSGGTLYTKPGYTKVELVSHTYTASSQWVELFSKRDYGTEPVTLTFTQPNAAYAFDDGTLVESGPNCVTFLPGYATTLRVKPYIHTTAYHTVEEPASDSGFSKVLSVRDVTLVNASNAQQVLQWLRQRGQNVQQMQVTIMADREQAGQAVTLPTPWGTTFSGYISKMKSTFTDTSHIAELTVDGMEETE